MGETRLMWETNLTEDNDSHFVVTTDGKVMARTVKRMPVETRFDQEIFRGCSASRGILNRTDSSLQVRQGHASHC